MMNFTDWIDDIPDFPKAGVMFRDISPLLEDPAKFKMLIEEMGKQLSSSDYDVIVGIDARGFVFASAMAIACNKGLVLARKAGKLPGRVITRSYDLEYGSAALEVQMERVQGKKVLIVDDVLATGGTMKAACDCVEAAGGEVAGIISLIELKELGGRAMLKDYKVYSMAEY